MKIASTIIVLSTFTSSLVATPARAATIIWEDSGILTSVSNQINSTMPGLTVGTSWSIQVPFDPNGPSTPGFGSTAGSPCNIYQAGSTTFTLGTYMYTIPTGQIWTNATLPQFGCQGGATASGAIVFELGANANWTQQPGAWNLNSGVLFMEYADTVHKDGTLPTVPSPGIDSSSTAVFPGLTFYDFFHDDLFPRFQSYPISPTPTPEPGTFAMLGIGLAIGARRLKRKA